MSKLRHFHETAKLESDIEANGYGDGSIDVYPQVIAGIRQRLDLLMPETHGRRLLDVGCGTGRILGEVATSFGRTEGVDAEPAMVERCRRAGLRVSLAAAGDLPFESGSFDVVLLNQVVVNFASSRQVRKVVRESWRVLACDGVLYVGALIRPLSGFPRHSHWQAARSMVAGLARRDSLKCYALDPRHALGLAKSLGASQVLLMSSPVSQPSWSSKYDLVMRK